MSKTQAQLLTAARERLNEPTQTHYLDTELRRWINDGAKDLCRRTEILQTRSTITAVVGTREYTLPTNVIRVYRATYTPTGSSQPVYPLEYRDFNNMDAIWWTQQAVTSSTPHLFTMWGYPPALKLIVYPIPSVAGTIEMFYYALPTELATDTSQVAFTLGIPEGWDDPVVDYVEYMALRKDRDPRWQEAKALYEEHVATLYDLSRRWSDQAGMVTPETPFLPAWLYEG